MKKLNQILKDELKNGEFEIPFKAIAEAIKQVRIKGDQHTFTIPEYIVKELADDLADICIKINPRFNRQKFLDATK